MEPLLTQSIMLTLVFPSFLPADLDGSLPGDFGFDPLKLGEQPQNLMRYREAEVIHCRWAMLGVVGCLGVEGLGYGKWVDAALWPWTGEQPTYFGKPLPYGLGVVVVVEFVLMGFVERKRAEQSDPLMRLYPGKSFDPLKLAGSGETMEKRKLQEIKNGRLAMLAMLGFFGQAIATQKGPLANLSDHIADPWHVNAATNPKAVPFLK